jgi:hypothetical protein
MDLIKMKIVCTSHQNIISKRKTHHYIYIYIYIFIYLFIFSMPFLHFEANRFCTNILFQDFCTDSIEISWYWKFVMRSPMMGQKQFWKRFIKHSQLDPNGPKLQNVQDIIVFLWEHLFSWPKTFYFKVKRLVTCVFLLVMISNVNHHTKYTCDAIKGFVEICIQ